MAFPVVHLLVAQGIAGRHPACHRAGFYLGSFSPDAIHMREGAEMRVAKPACHLLATGDGVDAVKRYWRTCGRDAFDIGYGVHVLTDRLWIGYYPTAFPGLMRAGGGVDAGVYQPDAAWIDQALVSRGLLAAEVLAMLRAADAPAGHSLLTAAEIGGWRDKVCAEIDGFVGLPLGKPVAMDLDAVTGWIDTAVDTLCWVCRDWLG